MQSESYDFFPIEDFVLNSPLLHDTTVIVDVVSENKKKELRGELLPEPLLKEDKSRFVLFPIKHNDVSSHLYL